MKTLNKLKNLDSATKIGFIILLMMIIYVLLLFLLRPVFIPSDKILSHSTMMGNGNMGKMMQGMMGSGGTGEMSQEEHESHHPS